MPRKAKTLSGAPAAPARMPVDTTYGEGERALESQRRTPVPEFAQPGSTAPTTGAGGAAAGGGGASVPASRDAQALMAAQAMAAPEGDMMAPTTRPLEPVQLGMGTTRGAVPMGTQFSDALFDLRALYAQYPEYRGLGRLIALMEDEA